ncbi:MAG: PorV/PorQ family protein [Bacteroidota bacterium]
MKSLSAITALAFLTLCATSEGYSQLNRKVGTASATQLLVPVGARDYALGGPIATTTGVESIHWNPAGMGRMTGDVETIFSNMQYVADIRVNYGAVIGNFGNIGVIGLSLKAFNFGDISYTTVDDPEGLGGRTYSPNYSTFGISYSRLLSDRISVGINMKLVSEKVQDVSASTTAFDVGVQYFRLAGIGGLNLAIAVKNIGSPMKYEGPGLLVRAIGSESNRPEQFYKVEAGTFELPSSVEIGVAYSSMFNEMLGYKLSGVFSNDDIYQNSVKIGTELSFSTQGVEVAVRGGFQYVLFGEEATREPYESAELNALENLDIFKSPVLGFGVAYDLGGTVVGADFAYRSVSLFGSNTVFSVRLVF